MSDHHEPSYYEIALTNRQVLAAFVVVLACVLAAFVAGVWVGRDAARADVGEVIASDESRLEDLERLDFFGDEGGVSGEAEPARATKRPDLDSLLTKPRRDTTLAEDVGAQPTKPRRRNGRAVGDPPPSTATSTPPPPATAPPPAAPPPPVAAPPERVAEPAPGEGFVIQVFSSREESAAQAVVQELVTGGHSAFLSPVEVGTQTMYRVRIGPFRNRAGAEETAIEVNREFKLDTWVTAASAGE